LAMEREGFTATLTSYESRVAALCERQERAVHDRDVQRASDAKVKGAVDLSRFRQPYKSPAYASEAHPELASELPVAAVLAASGPTSEGPLSDDPGDPEAIA